MQAPKASTVLACAALAGCAASADRALASAASARAARVVHLTLFRTPSSNIGCVLLDRIARCDIRQRSWSPPPRPASCPFDYGQGIMVGTSGPARFVCAGDTAVDPRARVLAYGDVSRVGSLSCSSTKAGVRCRQTSTGHGFSLSRQGYQLF